MSERHAAFPIDDLFISRWSPRAFTGERLDHADIMRVFEAARWAPSSNNAQPWCFAYALHGTPEFDRFLAPLNPRNQLWAQHASALIYLIARTHHMTEDGAVPLPAAVFDCGAAWAHAALQAHLMGLSTHGIGGFDHAKATIALNIPAYHQIQIAFALGRRGDKSILPEDLQAREVPNGRVDTHSFVHQGPFA
jgi:nitroreductase